jgi:hypothetical protein
VEAVGGRWTIALRPSPDPPSAEHSIDPGVNRDASLYFHATEPSNATNTHDRRALRLAQLQQFDRKNIAPSMH